MALLYGSSLDSIVTLCSRLLINVEQLFEELSYRDIYENNKVAKLHGKLGLDVVQVKKVYMI